MNNEELRKRNLETIKYFLSLRDKERGKLRKPLFTDDGRIELCIPGKSQVYNPTAEDWCSSMDSTFPVWGFYEPEFFETEDPNKFLVDAVGRGKLYYPDGSGRGVPQEINYILEFVMENGKIKLFREIFNPCKGGNIWNPNYSLEDPENAMLNVTYEYEVK